MYPFLHEDTNARYLALVREADEARLARSLRRPRASFRWIHWLRLRVVVRGNAR